MVFSFRNIVVIIVLLGLYINFLYKGNPELRRSIKIIEDTPYIDIHLEKYKSVIGKDYDAYRGHLYRVLTYTLHYLNGDETFLPIIGAALVYHDIGLWTDNVLSYLEPGCRHANEAFNETLSKEELKLLENLIFWHHKVTPFMGLHEDVVNAFRKADWIDATLGFVNQEMPSSHIQYVQSTIPNKGFHQMLAEFGPKLYGYDIIRIVTELSSIMKW